MTERQTPTFMTGEFLLGAAVGAGLALLFAPAAGSDTRRQISEAARTIGSGTKDKLTELTAGAVDNFTTVKSAALDKITDVKHSMQHDGNAVAAAAKDGRDGYRPTSRMPQNA